MASVPEVQGCRSQGRTITLAKRRIREALGLFVRDARTANLEAEVKLPSDLEQALDRFRAEATLAREAQARSSELSRQLVERAVNELNFSMREAGELLGVSHQRVDQIARRRPSERTRSKRKVATARGKARGAPGKRQKRAAF